MIRQLREKKEQYSTVGDLINKLKEFPSDYPIRIVGQEGWGVDSNKDLCFVKDVVDYDDACEIEII